MKTIWNIAYLHLFIALQDRSTYVQSILVPIILMVVLALANSEDSIQTARLLVDVVDQDQSALSVEFIQTLQTSANQTDTVIICIYGASNNPDDCELSTSDRFEQAGMERLEDLTTSAALIIPTGFGETLINGNTIALEYRSDSQFNNQTVARTTVDAALSRFNAALAIANTGVSATETYFADYEDTSARQQDFNALRQSAEVALQTSPATLQTTSSTDEVIVGLGTRQSVPGQGSMFVLFSLLGIASYMVQERNNGTLQRLMIVPTHKFNIVAGKILGVFLFGLLQFGVFILAGSVMGLDWGNDPFAILLLVVAYCLAGTALGFLVATFTRTAAQAANAALLFGLILAPLGGAWWPLTIVPDFMQTIGRISIISWVMEGFYELLYYNGTVIDVLPMVGALMAFAVFFMGAAVLRFRYE